MKLIRYTTKVILALSTLVFLITGCALQSVNEPHQVDPATEPTPVPTAVEITKPTYTVERGDVIREISISGRIVPISEQGLFFEQNGTVAEIFVSGGDSVEPGDLLARLDTSSQETDLILATNTLEVAKARLAAVETQIVNQRTRAELALSRAQLQLDYARNSADQPPTAEQTLAIELRALDVQEAELNLSELNASIDPALEAEIAQAQLRVDEITSTISGGQIFAPQAGTVTRISAKVGQSITTNDIAMVLADLSQLEVRATVNNDDLALLATDMAAQIQPAGRPGDVIDALLTTLPQNAGGTGTEDGAIRLTFENQGSDLSSNDRVAVVLVVAEHLDVLWLPPAAIREFQGRRFVVVQEGDAQRRADIKVGLQNDDQVEIEEGLDAGDVIVGQ